MTIDIALIGTLLSIALSIVANLRAGRKDAAGEAARLATIETKIDTILEQWRDERAERSELLKMVAEHTTSITKLRENVETLRSELTALRGEHAAQLARGGHAARD